MTATHQTGAQRAAVRLSAKMEANESFYRGIPRIGAASLYEGDLRQFRRREDRKAAKAEATAARLKAIWTRRLPKAA